MVAGKFELSDSKATKRCSNDDPVKSRAIEAFVSAILVPQPYSSTLRVAKPES